MKTRTIKSNMQYTRAAIKPNSFNTETRSFDVIFVTETPCPAFNWDIGDYNEILSCDPASVRMQRADNGLPVFDSHYPRTAMVQLGRADNIKFANGQGTATITLGARADEALISDLEKGIISGISVGYNVFSLRGENIAPGQTPTYRAIDWEPGEISFAPVQADPNSKVRNQGNESHNLIIIHNNSKMTIAEIRAMADANQIARLDTILNLIREANFPEEKAVSFYNSDLSIDEVRSLLSPKPVNTPIPPVEPVNIEEIRTAATKAERERLDAILKSTRAAHFDDAYAIELHISNKSIEEIRQAVIEKYISSDPKLDGSHTPKIGKEAVDKKREAAEAAILTRVFPSAFKIDEKVTPGAREMLGMSIHDIANILMSERAGKVEVRSKIQIAKAIFETREMSTSDFPLLLENVLNKALRADYTYAPEFWQQIARQTSVNDFKAKAFYQIESTNSMGELPEGDEIKYGKLSESKQSIKVKSYGEGLKFTRQMFINDDLSAFSRIQDKFVLDWNTLRGDLVWNLILDNVTMGDSKALFEANSHKNLLSGDTSALSETGLSNAIIAYKAQTGIDGKRKIRVIPSILIVSPELETTARKLLFTGVNPVNTSDVNIFAGQFSLIVENRLSGAEWYMTTNPNAIDGLYYAYLNGSEGLRSNREDHFDTDSIKFGVRGEFGTAAIDYRGWVKSAGK